MKTVLVICPYPYSGTKTIQTANSLNAINGFCKNGIVFQVLEVRGSNVPRARNAATKQAIFQDYDYALHIDADISFTPEQAYNLLINSNGLNIVGGAYITRDDQKKFCAGYWLDEKNPGHISIESNVPITEKGLIKTHWNGTGFLLLNLKELKNILPLNAPWFRYEMIKFNNGSEDFTSEDVGFGVLAQKYGQETWLDCSIVVDHIPFILPSVIPEVNTDSWLMQYNDSIDNLKNMAKVLCQQFKTYSKNIGGQNGNIRK